MKRPKNFTNEHYFATTFIIYHNYVTVIVPDYLHYFKLSDSYKML